MEFISQSWHWSFSGFMIAAVMFLLIMAGKRFGISSSFRALCSAAGAGKMAVYFDYDWKSHSWMLLFAVGSIIGGYIASHVINSPEAINISEQTLVDLSALGIERPSTTDHASSLLPQELFSLSTVATPAGLILFVLGGFFIGFGTRWAGGCTSGHAISGLSNLQLPSLVAVIGFFIGGLLMTHFVYPLIFA